MDYYFFKTIFTQYIIRIVQFNDTDDDKDNDDKNNNTINYNNNFKFSS